MPRGPNPFFVVGAMTSRPVTRSAWKPRDCQKESMIRTAAFIMLLDSQFVVCLRSPPMITIAESKADLPCNELLFANYYSSSCANTPRSPSVPEVIDLLMNGARDGPSHPALNNLGIFGHFTVIAGLYPHPAETLNRITKTHGFPGLHVMQRCFDNDAVHRTRQVPLELDFGVRDALRWGTRNGAEAVGMLDRIGTLTPGKQADVVLISPKRALSASAYPLATAVLHSSPADVDTVMVKGEVRKRDGHLVGHDIADIRLKAKAGLQRIMENVERMRPEMTIEGIRQ
ncbi:composite domain of metallo-dependent hydrolase [Aspergillus brunneoviolaceus CBS 621.78]|uniref:Composite domain of metallo-dependent hydrolase n=1 Tax=Aspergillus brunneoviolaceus CBS 621.78 TaxID=1450534 RepID=A0ACD1FZQ7_9EURO|nr:composite domain of metallo-dependent hydrolase [Aspergillus brunneoviolaceus CBS 621.78]RAH42492.1 composite domain of metallo-dependent hydrolase [Aspergillus brunneoviolaceus CBS 621.78]